MKDCTLSLSGWKQIQSPRSGLLKVKVSKCNIHYLRAVRVALWSGRRASHKPHFFPLTANVIFYSLNIFQYGTSSFCNDFFFFLTNDLINRCLTILKFSEKIFYSLFTLVIIPCNCNLLNSKWMPYKSECRNCQGNFFLICWVM